MSLTAVLAADPCASLYAEIQDRFGVLPALFRRASSSPDVVAWLWSVARFGYVDNPLPSLFKERLLVYLSRFCPVRYCVSRHVGFLLGSGNPAGDASCRPQTEEQVLRLVRTPLPRGDDLEPHLAHLERMSRPLPVVPAPETPGEEAVLSCAAHVFLRTSQATRCHAALRRALGPTSAEQLAVLLIYARTVHDWTRMHPEIEVDEDVEILLARHRDVARAVLQDGACGEDREATTAIVSDTRVQSASLLEAIVDLIPTSVFVKDAEKLTFVLVNRANEQLLGLSRSAQLGRTDYDFFPMEEAAFFQQKDREALAGDEAIDIPEEPIHTPLGVRWLHTRKISVRDAEGRPTLLLGISTDITEQKRAQDELIAARELLEWRVEERTRALRREIEERTRVEAALRASEELFRLAVEAFEGIIFDLDTSTGYSMRSPGMQAVLGYDPTSTPPTMDWWMEQVHPDDRARVESAYRELDQHIHGRIKIEYQVRHRDGSYRTIYERALVRPNAQGQLTRIVGCTIDVTDRVEALHALRNSEAEARRHHEELKAIYDTTPVGMCVLDPELRFVRLNERVAEMNGVPLADHIGRTVREVVPGVADQAEPVLRRILQTGEAVIDFELSGETPAEPGVERTWLCSYYPQQVDGRVVAVNVVAQEITDRKRAELLLLEHSRVLELIASGHTLRSSLDSLCRGLTRLTPGGRACIQLRRASDPSSVRTFAPDFPRAFREALTQAGAVDYARPECPESWRPVYADHGVQACHCAPILAPDGTTCGTVALCLDEPRDVRDWERRLAEFGTHVVNIALERERSTRAVRDSEVMFRTLGEAVEDLLWMADARGGPIYRNPAWYAYTGTSQEEPLRDRWAEVIHPDDLPEFLEGRVGAVRGRRSHRAQVRLRRRDGQYRWFQVRTVPVKDLRGEVERWVGTAADVHDLKEAKEALKDADQRKDEFLATLAHELRNPLAPIRNALRLIEQATDQPSVVAHARTVMERQLAHMVVLIDDLLDVSRISRGKVELRREPVEISAVIRDGVEAARPLVDQLGHHLTVSLPDEPVVVYGDLTRLAQVVGNLLTNSAKYTPPGGEIRVAAERQGDEVVVTVSDTGIGIPPSELERVFDLFSQVDRSLERTSGGLGIGLSLVRGLVQLHGGTVTASSGGEGKGSTLTVRLPVMDQPVPPAEAPGAEEHPAGGPRRVLVVDDNEDGAELLAELVRLTGSEVRIAGDGVEAVALAGEFRPDLILMDVAMPRMNGLDATRRIRAEPWGRSIRIVALSGWGQDSDRERSAEAGCDDHLVKPVDPRVIEDLLATLPPSAG